MLFNDSFPHYNVPGTGSAPMVLSKKPGFPVPGSSSGIVPEDGDQADMAKNRGMLSTVVRARDRCCRTRSSSRHLRVRACLALVLVVLAAGCGKKEKIEVPQARGPVRVVLLPANVRSESADFQWVAMGVPMLMAEAAGESPDLEIVPLWESMPIAKETAGDTRIITEENAAYIASRLTARWATLCNVDPDKAGVSLLLDFIPSKPTLVPFRYEKKGPAGELGTYFQEAFDQFLRYLVAAPLKPQKLTDQASLKALAEAVNREYGWSVPAEPGKSEEAAAGFARSHKTVAALIFNPNLYPVVGTRPAPKPAPEATPAPRPAASPAPQSPGAAATPQPVPQPAAQAQAAQPILEPDDDIVVPPPKSFTQRLVLSPEPTPETVPQKPEPVPERPSAAAARDPAPAPNKASPPRRAGEFLLQVFATRGKAEAETMAEKLRKAGWNPRIEAVEVPEKGIWHRIRLEGFESRQAAVEAGDKLVEDGLIKDYWITR